MHVFLTGATGYVGSYLLQALLDRGHSARCLVRSTDTTLPVSGEGIEKVKGDVANRKSLTGLIRGCDAVIHLVGIIDEHPSKGITFEAIHYEGTVNVVDEARDSGVGCFIQMSANGARPDGVSGYQTSKWRAEEYVRNAGFDRWTVFRPSLVFGDPGPDHPEFASRLASTLVKPFPILPIFGDGSFLLQPIYAGEVAAAFAQALTLDAAANKSYCVAGKERYPYTEVLDRIAKGLGLSPRPKLPAPLFLVRPVVHSIGQLGLLPISPAQFEMLIEGNTCDSSAFYEDFDVTFVPFTPENLAYLRRRD